MRIIITILIFCCWTTTYYHVVIGTPYILLKSKAPKCFQVDSPTRSNKKAIVRFHAPDLVIDMASNNLEQQKEQQGNQPKIDEGMDVMYNERQLKRLELMKNAHSKDIHITISPVGLDGSLIQSWLHNNNNAAATDNNNNIPQRKTRYQVEQTEGTFEINIEELGNHFEVCVQSYKATIETPSRISISIEDIKSNEELAAEQLKIAIKNHEILKNENRKLMDETKVIHQQSSQITAELLRMKQRSVAIVGGIDYTKQTEQQFFNMSIHLNKAVKYYPMARIIIIFMGGFIQVTYVVQYMKSRSIY